MVAWMVFVLAALGGQATLGLTHKPHQDWHTLPVEPRQDWHFQQASHQDWHTLQTELRQDWHMHPFPLCPAPQQDCHWAVGSAARLLAKERTLKVLLKMQELETPEMALPKEAWKKVLMGSSALAEAGVSEYAVVISPFLPMVPAESVDEAFRPGSTSRTRRPARRNRMARPGTGETLQAWSLKGCLYMCVQTPNMPHNMQPLLHPHLFLCFFRPQLQRVP